MKQTKLLITGLILIILQSCIGMFDTVKCREFTLNEENYWFPLNVGDTVSFINTKNEKKTFTVIDKHISHRNEYTSDTGCGCYDESRMLLTSGLDSLWFRHEVKYVYDQTGNSYEDVIFTFSGKQSGFYETHKTNLNSISIKGVTFNDVEYYSCPSCTVDLSVNKMYSVRNIGIVQFEQVNGEVWTKANLSNFGSTTKESFTYEVTTCN